MSLLDDVSIVVTPNGYKAGELYAVIPTIAYGSELVVNGDFSNGTTGWSTGNSGVLSVVDGALVVTGDGGSYASAQQIATGVVGKTYKLTGKVAVVSGSYNVRVETDQPSWLNLFTTSSTNFVNFEASFVCVNTSIDLRFTIYNPTVTSSDKIKIDDISLKEFTGADMDVTRATAATRLDENGLVNYAEVIGSEEITNGDFATVSDWNTIEATYTVNNNIANVENTSTIGGINQVFTTIIGETYRFTFTVADGDSDATIQVGYNAEEGQYYQNVGFTGTDEVLFVAVGISTAISLRVNSSVVGANCNYSGVSVKQIQRDNVPRIDYTGGGCPHILAEPQRTNTSTISNELDLWANKINVTITPDYSLSPDGSINSNRLLFSANGFTYNNILQVISTVYSLSVYAKRNSGTEDVGFFTNGSGGVNYAFNLTSEWQRFEYTYTSSNTSTFGIAGLSGADVSIFGFQSEVGSYPTSYIPTSGSTVTRNQDIFSRDGIGSLINSTEGVLFVEMAALSDDLSFRQISLSDGTSDNRVTIGLNATSNEVGAQVRSGGVFSMNKASAMTQTNLNKVAVKWKINDMAIWLNGSEVEADLSGAAPVGLNQLTFDRGDGTNDFYGKVKQLQVYDTALTDEQLLQLTGESGTDFYESYAEMASALTYTIQ